MPPIYQLSEQVGPRHLRGVEGAIPRPHPSIGMMVARCGGEPMCHHHSWHHITKFRLLNQTQAPQPNSRPSAKLRHLSYRRHIWTIVIFTTKPHRNQEHMVLSLCAGSLQKQACRSECYERADGPCTLCGDASHNVRTGWHVYFDQTWQSMFSQVVNRHSTEQHTCG